MFITKQSRSSLLIPLQSVSGIVEKNQTYPILSNILLEKENQRILLTSSDTDMQIQTWFDVNEMFESEPFATTFPARKCIDILRALSEKADITIEQQNQLLCIKSNGAEFKLQTLPAQDFPKLSTPDEPTVSLNISQNVLKKLISQVHFAMAFQDIRYYFNGMLFTTSANELKAVATDGHRLALATSGSLSETDFPSIEVILPRKTVQELAKLLSNNDENVRIDFYQTYVAFSFGSIELKSKLIEGKFPDYEMVIPKDYSQSFSIDAKTLQESLQRVSILMDDKLKGVRFILTENQLKVLTSNAEQEQAQEVIEIDNKESKLDIGLNITYLLDVLSNIHATQFTCAFRDSKSSILLQYEDNPHYKYVLMPMRI